jgi:hypothetical protein
VPYAFHFAPTSMTEDDYDELVRRLEEAGAGRPPGRMYHVCYGSGDRLEIFDVWDSPDSFVAFGQTLIPTMREMGLNPTDPEVVEIHNLVVGD